MASNATQVSCIDEELMLGDSHGNDVGDMVIRHGISVAVPVDEAINTADAVNDASSVVWVTRQRYEMRFLLSEAIERSDAMTRTAVAGVVEPVVELSFEVFDSAE